MKDHIQTMTKMVFPASSLYALQKGMEDSDATETHDSANRALMRRIMKTDNTESLEFAFATVRDSVFPPFNHSIFKLAQHITS